MAGSNFASKLSFHEDDVYESDISDSDGELPALEEGNDIEYDIISNNQLLSSQNEKELLLTSNSQSLTESENKSTQSMPPVLASVCRTDHNCLL